MKKSYYYMEIIAIMLLLALSFGLIFFGIHSINQALNFQEQCRNVQSVNLLGLPIGFLLGDEMDCSQVPNFLTMAEIILIIGIVILVADILEINRFNKIVQKGVKKR